MVVIQRPCLKCGALIPSGSYCGGCRPDYAPQRLRGRRWMRKRAAVFKRGGYICERCRNAISEEVHHVRGLDDNRLESLMGLCRRCHREAEAAKRAD